MKEGQTYQSNISSTTSLSDIETIPSALNMSGREDFVVFDTKATVLSRSSDITQLSAFDGKDLLNVYIDPRQPISQKRVASWDFRIASITIKCTTAEKMFKV